MLVLTYTIFPESIGFGSSRKSPAEAFARSIHGALLYEPLRFGVVRCSPEDIVSLNVPPKLQEIAS